MQVSTKTRVMNARNQPPGFILNTVVGQQLFHIVVTTCRLLRHKYLSLNRNEILPRTFPGGVSMMWFRSKTTLSEMQVFVIVTTPDDFVVNGAFSSRRFLSQVSVVRRPEFGGLCPSTLQEVTRVETKQGSTGNMRNLLPCQTIRKCRALISEHSAHDAEPLQTACFLRSSPVV